MSQIPTPDPPTYGLDPWAAPLIAAAPKVLQIVRGEIPTPEVVEIFPTNHCNFACPHCRFRELHGSAAEHISLDTISALLAELTVHGVKRLELSGGGEPLDHPEIQPLLELFATQGFRIGIISNGYALVEQPELLPKLLAVSDWVRFSVDGFSNAVYRVVHGRRNLSYDQFREMVKEAVARREPATVGLKMLVSRLNLHDVPRAIPEALDLGVRYLQLKFLGSPVEWVLSEEEMLSATSIITDQIRDLDPQRLAVEFLPPYAGPQNSGRCLMTYLHPVIDWDGAIYICAFFEHRRAQHSLGNIHNGGFFTHWFNPQHHTAFNCIDPATCVPNCPMKRYNPVVKFLLEQGYRFGYI